MKTISSSLIALLLAASSAQAFPPAPYYTLYGSVLDQSYELKMRIAQNCAVTTKELFHLTVR